MRINILEEEFILDPAQVLVWPSKKMLIVADIHLGKAQTFLQNGFWLPPEAHVSDLKRLTKVAESYDINQILFLGDFIHSKQGVTSEVITEFVNWKNEFQGEVQIVIGNHDRPFLSSWPKEWSFIHLINSVTIGNFIFQHEPPTQVETQHFVWCGHIHPKLKLGKGPDILNLPAFVIETDIGYLPAFTSLAAGMKFKGKKGSRYFVAVEGFVKEINY